MSENVPFPLLRYSKSGEAVVDLWRAIGPNALLEPGTTDTIVAEVVVEVPGHIEIEVPVVVKIQECRAY